MALPSVPLQFRISLSHVDRRIDRVQNVIVERHASESAEHLTLRVLAWCLFYDEDLRFGPGLAARNAADLWALDPTGKPTIWIECGAADPDELRKVILHNRGVAVRVLFSQAAPRQEFMAQAAEIKRRPREFDEMNVCSVDEGLVSALAGRDEQRQRWSVTVVEDHLYVENEDVSLDCEISCSAPPVAGR
jgi:uncharacterized protein YaeQ